MANLIRFKKKEISENDNAIALVMYAKDCVLSGKVKQAMESLDQALTYLHMDNKDDVHSYIIRKLNGDIDG